MNIDRLQPYLLSLFRFVAGLILFHYGVAKLFKFPPIEMFSDVTPLSLWGVAGMIELVLGGHADTRPPDAAGGFHSVGRDGLRLFHRAPSTQLLPGDQ